MVQQGIGLASTSRLTLAGERFEKILHFTYHFGLFRTLELPEAQQVGPKFMSIRQ
jgi:hypothetical protein